MTERKIVADRVVSAGTASGNRHIATNPSAVVYEDGGLFAPNGTDIVHEEHHVIVLPASSVEYEMTDVVTVDQEEEIRAIAD